MNPSHRFTTVAQALDYYARDHTHQKKAALRLHRGSAGGRGAYQTLSFHALNEVISRLAGHYQAALNKRGEKMTPNDRTVALYANSSPEYLLSLWALQKAGFVPLCVSPRNAIEAVSSLVTEAQTGSVVRGRESLLVSTTDTLVREGTIQHAVDMISPEELQSMVDSVLAGERHSGAPLARSEESKGQEESTPGLESVALMLHSSGSTGPFPKLVRIPHRYLASLLSHTWFPVQSDDVTYMLPPVYHAYGFFAACNILAQGTTMVLPAVQSWPPTTQMLAKNIEEGKCNVLCMLPWLLESIVFEAEESGEEGIYQLLASMRAINFSAAALNERVGDTLHRNGAVLLDGYGSSEAGAVAANQYNRTDKPCTHWAHIQIMPYVRYTLEPSDDGHNLYRLIIDKHNTTLALGQSNTPTGDYDMHDLLERVPCRPDGRECYVLRGRVDDVIVHSTGEKTSPIPIETAICANCPVAHGAVVVGQQRFNTALLVELKPGVKLTEEVAESLWRAVQVANQKAPQHSRIVREMIHVLRPGEEEAFLRTDKGSIKRRLTEERFKEQIDRIYAGFAGAAGRSPAAPSFTNAEQIAEWLEQNMNQLYRNQFSDSETGGLKRDVSIFSQGFDSLLATQFYYQHLRSAFPALKLPANILYQYPEIDRLAAHLFDLLQGGAESESHAALHNMQQAEELYRKFMGRMEEDRRLLGPRAGRPYERPPAESVVLTGCTGGLGVFLLHELINSPKVERVYALIRGRGKGTVKEMLASALQAKLLDTALVEHDKLTIWGCHLDQPQLGLTDDQWDDLTRHATSVIHNAWLLNFEASTAEFENSCIKPSYELMRLCSGSTQQSPKQFMFVSSITSSIHAVGPSGLVEEKPVDDQRGASGMGYGQSKLVTERLATQYAARFNVPVTIARVGQIAGDTVNGTWNTSEHLSLMIKAIETLGAMPDRYMSVDSLPVDIVASTMITLLADVHQPDETDNSGSPNTRVTHLVNPVDLPWLDFLKILQSPDLHLNFRIVSPDDWLRLLEQSVPDPVVNPIKKLQGYFVGVYSGQQEAVDLEVKFATTHTTELVPRMHYDLTLSFWRKVIHYWRSIGFLQTPPSDKHSRP